METNTFKEIMQSELEKTEDPTIAVSNAMRKTTIEMVKELPVWMRCNFLSHSLVHHKDSEIDWDLVNEILSYQNEDLDFNVFDKISSLDEFAEVRARAVTAEIPEFNAPYYKKTCKVCGDEFTLTRGEINFYQKKNLHIPCKCIYCRKNIEKPKPVVEVEKEPTVEKTQMQIALEKAGIC